MEVLKRRVLIASTVDIYPLGLVVVGVLCQAKMPLSGSVARVGSRMQPSVLVTPTSSSMRRYFDADISTVPEGQTGWETSLRP